MNKDEILHQAKSRLKNASSFWNPQYENIRDDRRMASGYQYDEIKQESNLPQSTICIIQPTIDKIVNELRANPYSIKLNIEDPKLRKLYQGLLRDIEYESNANEAYENAFESAVSTGMGAFAVTTEYSSDESLEQVIKIHKISDVTSVFIDPSSSAIDGSDMEYAFLVNWIDKSTAAREYNLDENEITKTPMFNEMFSHLSIPDDAVPETLYMFKERRTITRTWLSNGEYIDGSTDDTPDDMIVGSRKVVQAKVRIIKYIGAEEVESTVMDSKYIPIVTVYGDKCYGNVSRMDNVNSDPQWSGWSGIAKRMWDAQELLNLSASREKLLIETAPISQIISPAEGISGFEDVIVEANTKPFSIIPYNHKDAAGEPLPPPTPLGVVPQTGYLAQAQGTAIELAQRTSGIMDSALGREDISQQSGIAMMTKQQVGNRVISHYMDNLSKSIIQAGKIVMQLIDTIYDTERDVNLRSKKGIVSKSRVNVKETPIKSANIDVQIEAGPMFANERKETVNTLLGLGQLIPDKFSLFADVVVKNLDTSSSTEVYDRLVKMLPPKLKPEDEEEVNAPDPEAIAALQNAEATIQELQAVSEQYAAIIDDLQTQIVRNKEANETDKYEARLKAQMDKYKVDMDAMSKLAVEQIRADNKSESDDKRIVADFNKQMRDISAKLAEKISSTEDIEEVDIDIQQLPNTPDDAMQSLQKVGGPVGGKIIDEEAEEAVEGTIESIDSLLEQ